MRMSPNQLLFPVVLFIFQANVFSVTFCQTYVKTFLQDILPTNTMEYFLLEKPSGPKEHFDVAGHSELALVHHTMLQ